MDGFDGVTIAEFDTDMKICDLKEFQSKAERYYPYGELNYKRDRRNMGELHINR